jgi:hypothetical protein
MISPGFLSLLILAVIHLFANQAKVLGWIWHGRFISFSSGIYISDVFIDFLPALEKGQPALQRTFGEFIPYFDRHAYLIALIGVLFYYGIQTKSEAQTGVKRSFWFAIAGYLLFNFFLGTSLADSTNPDIQPLLLFTIAMGMHYFVRDHNAVTDDPILFEKDARWWLVGALFSGYLVGYMTHIPDAIVAVVVSFLAGGVFLNALRYELPKREQIGYPFFLLGALLYTAILLGVGDA